MISRIKIVLLGTALSVFIFITLFWMQFGVVTSHKNEDDDDVKIETEFQEPYEENLIMELKCKENETLTYDYESQTPIWGKLGGNIYVSAIVSLHCLGSSDDMPVRILRYVAEISDVNIEVQNKSSNSHRRRDSFNDFLKKTKVFGHLLKSIFVPSPKQNEYQNIDRRRAILPEETSIILLKKYNEEKNITVSRPKYSIPFLFAQFSNGTISHVLFASIDKDEAVKNFKRHIIYAFATFLEKNKSFNVEETPFGRQTTHYRSLSADTAAKAFLGWELEGPSRNSVLIKRWADGGEIVGPTKSDAYIMNNPENIDLWFQHVQLYDDGILVNAQGRNSLDLSKTQQRFENSFDGDDEEDDLMDDFKAQSSFAMKLRDRSKRSHSEIIDTNALETEFEFIPSSLMPKYNQDTIMESHLTSLRLKHSDIGIMVKKLAMGNIENLAELPILLEIIILEQSLGKSSEYDSITSIAERSINKSTVTKFCASPESSLCPVLLQVYSMVGGVNAEKVLISFIKDENKSKLLRYLALNSMSEVPYPTTEAINDMLIVINQTTDKDEIGTLAISLGNVASKKSVSDSLKFKVASCFLDFLENAEIECKVDSLVMDLFIALGNLKDTSLMDRLLFDVESCMENDEYQIVAINALRQMFWHGRVRRWITTVLIKGSCQVISALMNALSEEANPHKGFGFEADPVWPQEGFNELDHLFHYWLTSKLVNIECPTTRELYHYFENKIYPLSEETLRAASYFNAHDETRNKRSLHESILDFSVCDDLKNTEDKKEFASFFSTEDYDTTKYRNKKQCYGEKTFGRKKMNSVFSSGISILQNETDYKLSTKLTQKVNAIGRTFEVGKLAFYNQNGVGKAYAWINNKVRINRLNILCDIGTLQYQPFYHIPLYVLPVGIVQISFGIHLSGEWNLTITCMGEGVYRVQPVAKTRVALEALGILMPLQAAVNVGATFNTRIDSYLEPIPHMCANGTLGYDPMIISVEAWYMLPPLPREVWTPEFARWKIGEGADFPWTDFCLDPNGKTTISTLILANDNEATQIITENNNTRPDEMEDSISQAMIIT